EYTLSVELSGFKTYTHTNIPLAVQQQATFDVALDVGRLTAAVEVRSQAPLLNITISTLGQVIENRYMTALPNIGRNPLSFLNLTPGVNGRGRNHQPEQHKFRCEWHTKFHLGRVGGRRDRQHHGAEHRGYRPEMEPV